MAENADNLQGYFPLEIVAGVVQLTPRRVQQLVADGYIPKAKKGNYHLVSVVRGVIRYWRTRAEGGGGESGEKYAHHRARLLKSRADVAELELAEKRGQVARIEVIDAAVVGLITVVRNKFLGVPSFLASRMPQSVRAQVFKLAEDEIHKALTELSEGGDEILASMKNELAENDIDEDQEEAA